MSASALYRTAAVLLVLYAVGHTIGFRRVDAAWGIDGPLTALRSTTFAAHGMPNRTYWGFYVGFGLFCSVLLLFAAAMAWQLGAVGPAVLRSLQFASWAFAVAFAVTTYLTWRYFFVAPLVFSVLVTLALACAAWRAR